MRGISRNCKTLVILWIAIFIGTLSAKDTPFSINGRLKVVGTNLCNQNGLPIQLRGMSTHGIQWFPDCINDASLDTLAYGWGADILRISMYIQEGGYETNPSKFTALVNEFVDKAGARGMYALIDWHQLSPGDPNYNLDKAKTFFEHASKTHGSKGFVLYDICNEPNGSVNWTGIKSYAEAIIPIIRKNDPQSVIIVGTPNWASRPNAVIGNELDFPNVMYTMHFYAADHKDSYMNNVKQAIAGKIPVFVTEFGTQEASGDGGNDFTSSQKWLDLLKEYKISWCNWNYSDDGRSGAVWKSGACPGPNFSDSRLKEAGVWIKQHINTPDDFPTAVVGSRANRIAGIPRALISLLPNPCGRSVRIQLDGTITGNVTISIVDMGGRNFFSLSVPSNGSKCVVWNGKDKAGSAAPAGVYLVKVDYANRILIQRLTKISGN